MERWYAVFLALEANWALISLIKAPETQQGHELFELGSLHISHLSTIKPESASLTPSKSCISSSARLEVYFQSHYRQ